MGRVDDVSLNHSISVYSEIGKLKSVLLHRPGEEVENIVPDYLRRLLFDEICYLEQARREHDQFADILRSEGAEEVYCMAENDLIIGCLYKLSIIKLSL
jgi:arginine deiminase